MQALSDCYSYIRLNHCSCALGCLDGMLGLLPFQRRELNHTTDGRSARGLDVHKSVYYGTVTEEDGRVVKRGRFSNDPEGLEEFLEGVEEA